MPTPARRAADGDLGGEFCATVSPGSVVPNGGGVHDDVARADRTGGSRGSGSARNSVERRAQTMSLPESRSGISPRNTEEEGF